MKDNKNVKRLAEPDTGIYLLFMILFVAGAIFFKMYYLAAAEGAVVMVLGIYALVAKRSRAKQLNAYIESITYETENA